MHGDTMDGVFAGCKLGPGYTWHGLYRVWALADFVDTDLSFGAKALTHGCEDVIATVASQ